MENDPASPDAPKLNPPAPTRDPLIRYSVFAALGCAALCMVFTILYIFTYSLNSTLSFERHFDAYLAAGNNANLPTVLGLHIAQNRMFLQSCGMVAGIFFAFLGLALFLVGIQGTVDATGQVKDYSTNVKRLAPGGIILFASMIFVGVSAMHPIDFVPATTTPATILAPTISAAPTSAPTATPPASPTANAASTQSEVQTAPAPSTPQAAYLAPQSAQSPTTQPPSILLAQPTTSTNPAQTTPAIAPAQRPTTRLALVNQKASPRQPPAQHRFQP